MTDFTLGSDYTRALDHFAGYGLSAILEDAGENVRLHWTSDEARPRLTLTGLKTDSLAVAEAVRAHAHSHSDGASWVQRTTSVRGPARLSTVGLFSPRVATPADAAGWNTLFSERRAVLDEQLNSGRLDARMIHALGEPAYWPVGTLGAEPDRGASRWEMKTRNRGEDFCRNRLSLLAKSVCARTATGVLPGLQGDRVIDEVGKGAIDSRTGTGLITPSPVDNAVAWCALWGLSLFPVTHRVGQQSRTPGAFPKDKIQPRQMVLPLTTAPTSLAKFRRVLRSQAFDDAAFAEVDSPSRTVGRETLQRAGVSGLVRFPIRIAGSASAPERQVLSGTYEAL